MSAKLNFLVLSREDSFAEKILEQIHAQPQFSVHLETSTINALQALKNEKCHCLILNLDQFGFRQIRLIEQIRDLGFKAQIFIFAYDINATASRLVEGLHRVVIFDKSSVFIDRDLIGLCVRFLKNRKTPKRLSSRQPTKQRVSVEPRGTRRKFYGFFRNMTSQGAFLEYKNEILRLGQELDIQLNLSSIGHTHVLESKVMWIRVSSTGALSCGLSFTKKQKKRSLQII